MLSMSSFSQTVSAYWERLFSVGHAVYRDDAFSVTVNPGLAPQRRVMLLQTADERTFATLAPALADRLALDRAGPWSPVAFRHRLAEAGVVLHGADGLFYFSEADRAILQASPHGTARRLTDCDAAAFAEFRASAPAQDLDDAYVEFDHWSVFGRFERDRLACAASAYPWRDAPLADLGVLTLASHRGRGFARDVVRAIGRHAFEQGYEAQYRCQLDNVASVALASAARLTRFGRWEVVSPESPY